MARPIVVGRRRTEDGLIDAWARRARIRFQQDRLELVYRRQSPVALPGKAAAAVQRRQEARVRRPSAAVNPSPPALQLYRLSMSWTVASWVFFSHWSSVNRSVTVPSPLSWNRVLLQVTPVVPLAFACSCDQSLVYLTRHSETAARLTSDGVGTLAKKTRHELLLAGHVRRRRPCSADSCTRSVWVAAWAVHAPISIVVAASVATARWWETTYGEDAHTCRLHRELHGILLFGGSITCRHVLPAHNRSLSSWLSRIRFHFERIRPRLRTGCPHM